MSNLSARLLIMVTIALLPALSFQIYSESRAREMRQVLLEDEAQRLLHQVRADQQRIAEGADQMLVVLASAPGVREPIPDQCSRLLAATLQQSPRYGYADAIHLDGVPFCASRPINGVFNAADRPWFQRALQSEAFAMGDYALGRASGRPTIHFARPFRNQDGVIAGVVEVGLSLQWLNDELARFAMPPGSIVTISDRNGIVLARSPGGMSFVGKAMPPERHALIEGDGIRTFSSMPSLDQGRPMFVTASPPGADRNGLMVSVELDEQTMFASVTQENRISLVLIVTGACLALLLTILMGSRLIQRPVGLLRRAADRWRTGDLGARTGLVHGRDEFGRLANAFDDMAVSLEARERALSKSEERMRLAMEAARLGVRELDFDTRRGSWTADAARIMGRGPEEDTSFESWIGMVHPDDRAAVLSEWQCALADPAHFYETEYRFAQPDGTWRSIGAYGRAIFEDGRPRRGVVVIQDITARKQAEQALRDNEARLRMSQEVGRIGTWDWDLRTGTLHWSETQCRQFGIDPALGDAVTYDMWRRVVHPDDLAMMEAKQASDLDADISTAIDYRIVVNGKVRWIHARAQVFRDETGTAVRKTGIDMDITERRALEDELRSLTADLETRVRGEIAAREAAQSRAAHAERMQALGQLAGGIAHDINNVLQAAAGSLALIERRSGDAAAIRRFAQLGGEAIERGASITSRLLAFSRRGDLRAAPLDLGALLQGLHEILSHTLGIGIEVRLVIPAGLPAVVADKGQLETVLINLATNARDAMPAGGQLIFSVKAETITGDAEPYAAGLHTGEYVRLTVADTGFGMDATTLAHAREPFFTTKPTGSGTGLGLSMALGFVEQSGGAMTIESQPGKGTAVILWLPQANARSAADSVAADTPARQTARILLVDDEAAIREGLSGCLSDAGYVVATAADGNQALAMLEADDAVDALITDLSMPGMDGLALIAAVRRQRPNLPAILLTGFAREGATLAVSHGDNGPVSLLRKPISDTALLDRLGTMLAAGVARRDG